MDLFLQMKGQQRAIKVQIKFRRAKSEKKRQEVYFHSWQLFFVFLSTLKSRCDQPRFTELS